MSMILDSRKEWGTFNTLLNRQRRGMSNLNDLSSARHHSQVFDYQGYFKPSDNIWSSSGQSGEDKRPTFTDLEMAAFERTGIGDAFTRGFAKRTVRNWFDFFDWEGNFVRKPAIVKSLFKANFYTEQIHWVTYELVYGTCFLWKIWTGNDHKKLEQPPPKTPPLAYKAIPPTYIMPTNIGAPSQAIWDDDTKWKFWGGKYRSQGIHRDRIEILCTRPNPNSWLGFSIFEPNWLSYCAYMNLILNGLKMVAKFSNVVPVFKMAIPNPSLSMYTKFAALIEQMKANLTFVIGKEEELDFKETKMGSGLAEFGNFLREDLMAGTGHTINQTFGLAEGGGMDGAGALISKQNELETSANYQADLADNVWAMLNKYWNVDDLFVKYRLEAQKTDRGRYEEEALQWDNEIRKKHYEQLALQNLMTATQIKMFLENPEMFMLPNQTGIGNQSGGKPANQSGGNGGAKRLQQVQQSKGVSLQQIQKTNQDFIDRNFDIFEKIKFKPRVIDMEFRQNHNAYLPKKKNGGDDE